MKRADKQTNGHLTSFDVFDTVLTRAVGSPEAVFLLLGRHLSRSGIVTCAPDAFARLRIEAEGRAYRNVGDGCTLQDIYAELGATLQLTEAQHRSCLSLESELEADVIRLVPGAIERVRQVRSLGQRIAFLSDVYLPKEFLREQLQHHGLWQAGDALYVSSECGRSKTSGALFTELLRQEGLTARQVNHQGNSLSHDLRPAAQARLRVQPFFEANLNRYETVLEGHSWTTEGLASAMAGASRLVRLSVPGPHPKEAARREVAAGVAAPTLVSYVLWILHRAEELGLKHLYFLSRDGQILLEIARRLAQSLKLRCELHYLYGSRQSWNLPAIREGADAELAWVWDETDVLSVKSLLARVGLEPEQLRGPLSAAGLGRDDWVRPLHENEKHAAQQTLLTAEGRALILERAAQKRRLLLRYFEQEGILSSFAWGLVDLGWYGSMQNALAAVAGPSCRSLPVGFYFALYKGEIKDIYPVQREAYYFDERQGQGYIEQVPNLIALLEMFCTARHGTVIDFAETDGFVRPVLKSGRNEKAMDWGLPLIQQTICSFADHLLLNPDHLDPWSDMREAVTEVLRAFWVQPSPREARAWADFPWEDGLGAETYWNRLAHPYHWRDVAKAALSGRVEIQHRASWLEGSLSLSSPGVRLAMNGVRYMWRKGRVVRTRLATRLFQ